MLSPDSPTLLSLSVFARPTNVINVNGKLVARARASSQIRQDSITPESARHRQRCGIMQSGHWIRHNAGQDNEQRWQCANMP